MTYSESQAAHDSAAHGGCRVCLGIGPCTQAGCSRAHSVIEPVPVIKMSIYGPAWRGACLCGWQSNGWSTSKNRALKDAQQHVDAKSAA